MTVTHFLVDERLSDLRDLASELRTSREARARSTHSKPRRALLVTRILRAAAGSLARPSHSRLATR
jgi:signal transduction protein with GAF and PtsI domain